MNVALLEELLGLLKTLNETVAVGGESLEDKNVLQGNTPSNPNNKVNPRLNSNERTRTTEIATLFATTFFEYQKKKTPDTAIQTSIQKVTGKTGEKIQEKGDKVDKKSSWTKILLLLIGGIAALITGLMTDGPFKGALKIAAKALLQIAKTGITSMFKMSIGAIKGLLPNNFLGKIIGDGVKGLVTSLKGIVSAPFKALGGMFKGGLMAKMLGFLKPLVSVLRRIPLLGSIISIGFAISRFSSGDNIGGVIDVLSALSGLLYLTGVGAPVAFAIGLGLDLLNAFLDVKTGGATGKQQGAKINLLGDMAKGIGKWIWKNSIWLPVIGGFRRMQMSWDAFKGGDIMGGLYQFGASLLSFGGLSPIITGIEMLLGFGGGTEKDKSLSPKKGWFSGLKGWIKKKLKDLPYVLRKPLEWFGILDDDGKEDTPSGFSNTMSGGLDKLKEFSSKTWESASQSFSKGFDWFKEKASTLWSALPEAIGRSANWIADKFNGLTESFGKFFISLSHQFEPAIDKIKKFLDTFVGNVLGWVKNLLSFSKSESDTPETNSEELSRRAKSMGWSSVEEYEKSGWKSKNTNTVVADAIKTVKPVEKEVQSKPTPNNLPSVQSGNPQSKNTNTVVADAIKTVKPVEKEVQSKPTPNNLPSVQSGNPQSLEFLRNIGMTQIKIMGDIERIAAQILKKMDSSMGGGSQTTVVPASQPQSSQKSSPIPMNTNRGDYGSSPYALA